MKRAISLLAIVLLVGLVGPVWAAETIHIPTLTMEADNPYGELSNLTFLSGDKSKAFLKIYSGLSVGDVTSLWNDFRLLKDWGIKNVDLLVSSPGGDAFAGLAMANLLVEMQNEGFNLEAYAYGLVASAAMPVYAVVAKRYASSSTVFMVHEASLWKWPGRESASDIRAQGELMDLLSDLYLTIMERHSNVGKEKWRAMELRTSWFSAEQAKEWGLVDEIVGIKPVHRKNLTVSGIQEHNED